MVQAKVDFEAKEFFIDKNKRPIGLTDDEAQQIIVLFVGAIKRDSEKMTLDLTGEVKEEEK